MIEQGAAEIDQLIASAARFLIDGHDEDAANVVLACSSIRISPSGDSFSGRHGLVVSLVGPRVVYDILDDNNHPVRKAVKRAFEALIEDESCYIEWFRAEAETISIDPDWRAELLEIARGKGMNNQRREIDPSRAMRTWNNLRFRSESERRIAQALDRAGALFLPNCIARLSSPDGRRNREPDFLICHEGRVGILEVDGEPFHPPSRTTEDHARDRLFLQHGIRVVQHFCASRCFEEPDIVVKEFLELLKRSA